jgi:hypothetical protein
VDTEVTVFKRWFSLAGALWTLAVLTAADCAIRCIELFHS